MNSSNQLGVVLYLLLLFMYLCYAVTQGSLGYNLNIHAWNKWNLVAANVASTILLGGVV